MQPKAMNAGNDGGALTWIASELEQALERARAVLTHHALRERRTADDNVLLRQAINHLHQAHGALEVLGLHGTAHFAEILEVMLDVLTDAAVHWTEVSAQATLSAMASLRAYLDNLAAGMPDQPVQLYAPYLALFDAQAALRPTPADLFFPDLTHLPPPRADNAKPLPAPERDLRFKAARLAFERGMQKWINNDNHGLEEMRKAVAMVEMAQTETHDRAFWWVALAFFDVLIAHALPETPAVMRTCERIFDQIVRLNKGASAAPARLMRDVLYFIACAETAGEHVENVRATWRLTDLLPAREPAAFDNNRTLLAAARESLSQAMTEWNLFCQGKPDALARCQEQLSAYSLHVDKLAQADCQRLARALTAFVSQLPQEPGRLNETAALEIAMALLLAERGLVEFTSLDARFARQTTAVAERIDALNAALHLPAAAQAAVVATPAFSAPPEEYVRHGHDTALIQQVVKETRANLALIEQTLEAFFRAPQSKAGLALLKQPLAQIEGALKMVGATRAFAAFSHAKTIIAAFAEPDYLPDHAQFEAVANDLSALGMLVSALREGDEDSTTFFNSPPFDPSAASDHPANAQTAQPTTSAAAKVKPPPKNRATSSAQARAVRQKAATAAAEGAPTTPVAPPAPPSQAAAPTDDRSAAEVRIDNAAELLAAIVSPPQTAARADTPAAESSAVELHHPVAELSTPAETAPPAPAAPTTAHAELNAELLGIFLEEAHDVLAEIDQNFPKIAATPGDPAALADVRRSFHTLKGSGRMVGLIALGEAAWAVEQLLNGWLEREQAISADLVTLLDSARELMRTWVAQLNDGNPADCDTQALLAQCARLKQPSDDAEKTLDEAAPAALSVVHQALAAAAKPVTAPVVEEDADAVRIGEITLSASLYSIFMDEAQSYLRVLLRALGKPGMPDFDDIRAAHTLGSIAGVAGFGSVHELAHALERALGFLAERAKAPTELQRMLLAHVVGALERMITAIGERQMPADERGLVSELAEISASVAVPASPVSQDNRAAPAPETAQTTPAAVKPATAAKPAAKAAPPPPPPAPAPASKGSPAVSPPQATERVTPIEVAAPVTPAAAPVKPVSAPTAAERREVRLVDDIDAQLLPIFLEEAEVRLPELTSGLRAWNKARTDAAVAEGLMRTLHTFKGSARMIGAMGIGELAHSMESRIEQAVKENEVSDEFLERLDTSHDRIINLVADLRRAAGGQPTGRFAATKASAQASAAAAGQAAPTTRIARANTAEMSLHYGQMRVAAALIDRMTNEAGELAIARSRIEGEMRLLKGSLLDLTENVIRLRTQVREVEIEAEAQMQSHEHSSMELVHDFDPLEFDRFTRFQELTRMMAEGVNDVATVQQSLLQNVDHANAALAAQAVLNRDLSQTLMGARMMPFASIADRLYAVVRTTAKELGQRANLDIRGGQIGIDRSILERLGGPLEHLLRNAVVHGIDSVEERRAAGKPEISEIVIAVSHLGNEIIIAVSDDGRGLNLALVRAIAAERALLSEEALDDEAALTQLLFAAGFTTATEVTQVAGRGVGLDAVRTEVTSLGGRIEVETAPGRGTTFYLALPLTLAVTHAVMVRCGNQTYAIPSSMVHQLQELSREQIYDIRANGYSAWRGNHYPWRYLAHLLGDEDVIAAAERRNWLLLLAYGQQRLALQVDSMLGNQEIVVKKIGPQLARVRGIIGATVLGDGAIVLILNPVMLATPANLPVAALATQQLPKETDTAPAEPQKDAYAVAAALPSAEPPALAAESDLAEEAAATAAPAPATDFAPSGAPIVPTVMVVDDSLTVRKITGRLLAREGYHVFTAKDGVDALEQLAEKLPSVVLADIEMPRMDGFELVRAMRNDTRLTNLPVIMITSRIAEKHRNYAREIGVDHYLGKPYDEDELLALIAEFVRR